jgi:hypothetical protein
MATDPLSLLLNPAADFRSLSLQEWDRLLPLARAANLIGRLAERARPLLAELPVPVARQLLAALRLSEHQQQAIGWECSHLAHALVPAVQPLVLLKGAAYALADQAVAKGRLFGDVDLLVPRALLAEAESRLVMHGWGSDGGDPYDQRYYRQWMHELPPLAHRQRGTVVDVHHNILPLTSARVPDAALLLQAAVPIPGTAFHRLALPDQIVHSATHLYHEGDLRNGLRDLHDLAALLTEHGLEADAGERLLARAQQLGLVWPVLLALRHVQAVLRQQVPLAMTAQFEAAAGLPHWRLRWLDILYRQAFRPTLTRPEPWPRQLALAWLYLRGHSLRMPPGRLLLHLGRKAMLRLVKHSTREA